MQLHIRDVAVVLAAGLALVACSDGDDIEPVDPPDASEAPSEPEPPEEPQEPEEPEPEIFQGQLYPPLPDDLEPDPAAGDVEAQEEVLAVFPEFFDAFENAFATNEVGEVLPPLVTDERLEAIRQELGAQAEQNLVSLNPDGEVGWVEMIAASDEEVAVGVCVDGGPESGAYNAETGERVSDFESLLFIRVFTFASSVGGESTWQLDGLSSQSSEEGTCGELRN